MNRPVAPLAKTSPPQIGNIFPRARLFDRLDALADRPVTWIAGPGGAGKTSLAASYLKQAGLPCIWYQVDAGDSDIATFFHYMAMAAKQSAPHSRKRLPQLKPEYLAGVEVFTRRFFQELFAVHKPPFALVLDNYQLVPAGSPYHRVIAVALEALPPGARAIVVSRTPPPAAFSRLKANRLIGEIDWPDLKLRDDEIEGIAMLWENPLPLDNLLPLARQQIEGWTAGLVLVLQSARSGIHQPGAANAGASETIFQYFAGEILDQADYETRDFLLQTALLPSATVAMARSLTGNDRAEAILEHLHQNHFFTNKNSGRQPTYQYHPLFREFLLARMQDSFSTGQLASVSGRAAVILDQAGYTEDATELFSRNQDWSALARIIVRQADSLLKSGRLETLERWLNALPDAALHGDPWLLFWLGNCRLPFDPAEAREKFSGAFQLFMQYADTTGAHLAWAAAVETFLYEWGDFTGLDSWIAALAELQEKFPVLPSAETEARVVAAMFSALMFRQPEHADLPLWEARAQAVLHSDLPLPLKVRVANHLVLYYTWWVGETAKAALVVDTLKPAASSPQVDPLTRIMWHLMQASHLWTIADQQGSKRVIDAALGLARETGIHFLDMRILSHGVLTGIGSCDPQMARDYLARMKELLPSARPLDRAHFHYVAYLEAMAHGEVAVAHEYAQTALAMGEAAGVPYACAVYGVAVAQCLFEKNEYHRAACQLGRARRLARAMNSKLIEYGCWMYGAEYAFRRGKDRFALRVLRHALGLARQQVFVSRPLWRPDNLAQLCVKALEADIETGFVQQWIRRRGLMPDSPPVHLENWPWPVRIYTLGRFDILLEGDRITTSGKAPGRPLDLLRALIAFGGRDVAEARLSEALWPEAEGDAAHRTFDTTLHRLRRILGHKDALVLAEGRLTLNPARCWVDLWSLERDLGTLAGQLTATSASASDRTAMAQRTARLLAAYRGNFLKDEAETLWSISTRESVRGRFLRSLSRLADYWLDQGDHDQAIDLYRRGLELDPLAESFYQGLIGVQLGLGHQAEAVSTLNRCERALREGLGIEPSVQTRRLLAGVT